MRSSAWRVGRARTELTSDHQKPWFRTQLPPATPRGVAVRTMAAWFSASCMP